MPGEEAALPRERPSLPPCLEEAAALARYAADGLNELTATATGCKERRKQATRRRSPGELRHLPPEQRERAVTLAQAENIEARMRERGKCARCMFQTTYCICEALASLRSEVAALHTGDRVRFAVWMHVRERQRATNTGKLLEHVLPGSTVLVHDVPADAKRFGELLAASSGRAFVLYPSEGAWSPAEALQRLTAQGSTTGAPAVELLPQGPGPGPAAAPQAQPQPLLAVLVDGTWRQARRMNAVLEGLPHVALAPRAPSAFHWRRQTREDRISTVEAAGLLLEDLGEPAEAAPKQLQRALEVLNGALERQSHYDTFCNGPPPPEPGQNKLAALAHKLPKRGPRAAAETWVAARAAAAAAAASARGVETETKAESRSSVAGLLELET